MKDGLYTIARAIDRLGNADAATPMGGLEALGAVIKEGDLAIASALSEVARAIWELAFAVSEAGYHSHDAVDQDT